MSTISYDGQPFSKLATEEDFNARVSEAIRCAAVRADVGLRDGNVLMRLIDFEDRTTIAFGKPAEIDAGWRVSFEVGGTGTLYTEDLGDLPHESGVPCVCRGDLEVGPRKTGAVAGEFSVRIGGMEIYAPEVLDRP